MTLILIAVFMLIASTAFTLLLSDLPGGESPDPISKRLAAIERVRQNELRENDVLLLSGNRAENPGFDFEAWIRGFRLGRELDIIILQSGSDVRLRNFVLATTGCAVAAGVLVEVCVHGWPLVIAATLVSGSLPYILLQKRRVSRLAQFEAALPEAIALMARCLRAGHSIGSALEVIADQSKGPLAEEFAQVSQQQRLGVVFRESILELADRVPSQDLHFLVTAILVQRESGGDLTQVLDSTIGVISDRMRIAAQVRVHSAQGRFSGWILSALPFVIFAITNLLNPGYSRLLFTDPTGRLLLYAGLGSIGLGVLMIRKIVDVKA